MTNLRVSRRRVLLSLLGTGVIVGGIGLTHRLNSGRGVAMIPISANELVVVMRTSQITRLARVVRHVGGLAGVGSNVGGPSPEWRLQGLGLLKRDGDRIDQASWIAEEIGAWDLIARNKDGDRLLGSYHGLGSGRLVGETITLDGKIVELGTQSYEGSIVEIRNATSAVNGEDVLERDLSLIFGPEGITMRVNSITATNMRYVRFGMPMATGDGFSTVDTLLGTDWRAIQLGDVEAQMRVPRSVQPLGIRMRDEITRAWVSVTGQLSSLPNFGPSLIVKQPRYRRTKTYFGHFTSDFKTLTSAEVHLDWGDQASPHTFKSPSLISSNWDLGQAPGEWSLTESGGKVVQNGNELQIKFESQAAELFAHTVETPVQKGKTYAAAVDAIGQAATSDTVEFYAAGSKGGALDGGVAFFNRRLIAGRNVELFVAGFDGQPIAVRQRVDAAHARVLKSPGLFAL